MVDIDWSSNRYTVYHSIGHTNYIPIIQANNMGWADQPVVEETSSYYFIVRYYNVSGKSYRYPFSYVCFLADQPKS